MVYSSNKNKEYAVGNISDYSQNKILFNLAKKHSPYHIRIVEDINDSWFIHILKFKPRSGNIADTHFIIKPDLNTWLSHLKDQGYSEK